jgi:hypothetical protein
MSAPPGERIANQDDAPNGYGALDRVLTRGIFLEETSVPAQVVARCDAGAYEPSDPNTQQSQDGRFRAAAPRNKNGHQLLKQLGPIRFSSRERTC